ncbi:unnamed protein product, partial [Rotaria sordida]
MLELERRNILPQHQAGFRPGKSTVYNIVRLERYAEGQLRRPSRRRHSAAILFDIKAAFDSVWHDGLIYKLNDYRLPRYIINYLISFLQNRTAAIEIENVLSRPFNLKSGTPQGSPLSPLLYIIYTADSMNGIPTHTEHGLFADDTALWTSGNTMTILNTSAYPAGLLRMSAGTLSIYLRMFLNNELPVLRPQSIAAMRTIVGGGVIPSYDPQWSNKSMELPPSQEFGLS